VVENRIIVVLLPGVERGSKMLAREPFAIAEMALNNPLVVFGAPAVLPARAAGASHAKAGGPVAG
jgi:hypothetical protein